MSASLFKPNEDIFAIELDTIPFELGYHHSTSGSDTIPTATIGIKRGKNARTVNSASGSGQVAASYKALDGIFNIESSISDYGITNLGTGVESSGHVQITIEFEKGNPINGTGTSADIIEASILAYLDAYNKWSNRQFAQKSQ